jgi:cysteinyl-tRNA synthetase
MEAALDAVAALSYWLGILGVKPDESWLAEAPAQLPADFLDRLSAALGKTVDAATPPEAIERVIAMRSDARRAKDWEASDRLRDALAGCGVELKDSKEGTTWTIAV